MNRLGELPVTNRVCCSHPGLAVPKPTEGQRIGNEIDAAMTQCQSRWINVIIIALVVILRALRCCHQCPPSDEGYYGTIANDILDGGAVYHTAVDTKPPGMYYVYAAVFRVAGRNNLFAVHLLAIFVVAATALVLRRIGARVADDWAGAWSGIGYAVFVHALPAR